MKTCAIMIVMLSACAVGCTHFRGIPAEIPPRLTQEAERLLTEHETQTVLFLQVSPKLRDWLNSVDETDPGDARDFFVRRHLMDELRRMFWDRETGILIVTGNDGYLAGMERLTEIRDDMRTLGVQHPPRPVR